MSHYLYRLYDLAGDLLYVGITNDIQTRLGQHARDKSWWGEVETRTIETFPTREQAAEAEAKWIRIERPRHNVVHSSPARTRRKLLALTGESKDPKSPRGHLPPNGMRKVTLNFRHDIRDGVWETARGAGVWPVAVIEALLAHYLADADLQQQVNYDATHVMAERRRFALAADLAEADDDLRCGRTMSMEEVFDAP